MWNEVTKPMHSALKKCGIKRSQYSVAARGAKLRAKLKTSENERMAIREILGAYYAKPHSWLCMRLELSDGESFWLPLSDGKVPDFSQTYPRLAV